MNKTTNNTEVTMRKLDVVKAILHMQDNVLYQRRNIMMIDYAELTELMDIMHSLDGVSKKIATKYVKRKMKSITASLVRRQHIQPHEFLEFCKFYIATKDIVHHTVNLRCTVSRQNGIKRGIDVQPDTVEYFRITSEGKRVHRSINPNTITVFTDPTTHGNINITITKSNNVTGTESSITMSRMFFSTNEDTLCEILWFNIITYIKEALFNEYEGASRDEKTIHD